MSNFGYRALKLAPAAVLTAALLTALAGCDSNSTATSSRGSAGRPARAALAEAERASMAPG